MTKTTLTARQRKVRRKARVKAETHIGCLRNVNISNVYNYCLQGMESVLPHGKMCHLAVNSVFSQTVKMS